MGHYLGLYHTFQDGCGNSDCSFVGDRVCDTPPDNTTARVPCTDPSNSCNTDTDSGFSSDQNDMINNYMDYSNLECYNAFTQGQADRMHFFKETSRKSLLNSKGCEDPCPIPVSALFSPGIDQTISAGTNLSFTNNSTNSGNFVWKINGLQNSTSGNFNFTFSDTGIYDVTLIAESDLNNCRKDSFSVAITVICPVVADFSASQIGTTIDEMINFTNQNQNANTYEWEVNRVLQSTTTNFSFSSAAPGLFEICLTSSNAFCNDRKCLWVEFESISTGCDESAISYFGTEFSDETPYAITAAPDGNLLVGGSFDDKSFISKMDTEGEVIWTKVIDFSSFSDEKMNTLFIDSDGYLVDCGTGNPIPADPSSGFAFKFDLSSNQLVWNHETQQTNPSIRYFDIEEIPNSDNYIISGRLYENNCQGLLIKIDKNR